MSFTFNSLISFPQKATKIVEDFKLRLFSIKDTKLTYRALNHYKALGLIEQTNQLQNSWSKFNGTELVWINIIFQLRELGVSLEKIFLLKKYLFSENFVGSIDKTLSINNSLEKEIALSLFNNYDLYLIVFFDFTCTFRDSQSIKQWYQRQSKDELYINLPLSKNIKEIAFKIKMN